MSLAGFEFLEWTYVYQIAQGTDVKFEQGVPPDAPFYTTGPGPTYTCEPRPGAPPEVQPIECPAPIDAAAFGPWIVNEFPINTQSPSLRGTTFGAPPEPRFPPPDLPIRYMMIDYELSDAGSGSLSATIGCGAYPLGALEGSGRPFCGPNATLGPIEWTLDVGGATAAVVLTSPATQEASGRLMHASSDPATWHYTAEPDNPNSRYLFDPARCSSIRVQAECPGYSVLNAFILIQLRPLSLLPVQPDGIPPAEAWGNPNVIAGLGGLKAGSVDTQPASGGLRGRGRILGARPAGSTSGWATVGATYYNDPPPGAGELTAPGFHFAELGTARRTDGGATGVGWAAQALGMSGELPMGYQLDIEYGGQVITADKQDRGYGQGGDGITSDPHYAIDLWDGSASGGANAPGALNFPGEGDIKIRPHTGSVPVRQNLEAGVEINGVRMAGARNPPSDTNALTGRFSTAESATDWSAGIVHGK